MPKPITPEEWRTKGSEIVVPDGRIFTVDMSNGANKASEEASAALTPILVLHGFPSSSWDFADAAAIMEAAGRRVVLFDFLGFGLSDKPEDAGYSLFEQAEIAMAVARNAKLKRVHLWAHDMGTSVALELLARRERGLLPFEIASLTLMNGSVYIEMASLTVGQHLLRSPAGAAFARIAGKTVFIKQMKRILGKPVPDEALDGMWAFIQRADGRLRLPKTISYVQERHRFRRRWIGALERVDIPVLVAWGAKDPVALLAIAERLARETPGAEMTQWDDLGHYPQVEDAARVASDVLRFIVATEGPRPRVAEA
jgi:pimeloyl-ACP methyl ester carboxylesterase